MNKETNLFDEINQKVAESKKNEDEIETKWQERNEKNKIKTSIEEVRSDLVGEEESLRKNQRERLFHQRRIQKSVKQDAIVSLKEKLTISHELYDSCQQLKPNVKFS
jgi:hypothetical protein